MFWNNVKIALRNLRKNKVFALVNILGLALGLTIYVFGGLLVKYESTHDMFFENAANTYTIGSIAAPDLDVGIDRFNATFTTVGPIIEAELQDVRKVARTVPTEFLLSVGDKSFYEGVNFSDAAFLEIFDFTYIHGDAKALQDPSGLVLTESSAIKYFGRTDVVNETITFDNEFDFHVTGVIEDVPLNSHFSSSVFANSGLNFIAPINGLNRMRDWDLAGNWNNLSIGNMTYVLLPETLGEEWLTTQVDGIYERMVPDDQKKVLAGLTVSPLQRANLAIWDMIGMPVIAVVSLLSFLVLIVACVNYTNLATAQSLGRSREVGMRKTMGASQLQLIAQFLIESLVIASLAMIVAIAALELVIPLFNNVASKSLTLDYLRTLPWLVLTTMLVGLIAGMYPAWLITRASPIDALRDLARKGKKGARMRAVMIGAQFAISAFMLAIVSIVFMQNEKVKESSYIFPRSEIYTMDRLFVEGIQDRLDTLKNELEAIPNVSTVSYSSQVPLRAKQLTAKCITAARRRGGAGQPAYHGDVARLSADVRHSAARRPGLDRNIAQDLDKEDRKQSMLLINELAVTQPAVWHRRRCHQPAILSAWMMTAIAPEFIVVGVVPTQNIVGLFNEVKPWMFTYDPEFLACWFDPDQGGNIMDTVEQIEDTWKRVIPEYPTPGPVPRRSFRRCL